MYYYMKEAVSTYSKMHYWTNFKAEESQQLISSCWSASYINT